jgi:uncharacterized protein (DUF433 family)
MSDIQIIGQGVYTLPEAYLYSNVSVQRLSRWIFGSSTCDRVFDSNLGQKNLVSFLDLVQAMAVDAARNKGIPLHKIRQALQFAKDKYGIQFPLAHRHQLQYYDSSLHIVLSEKIIQATSPTPGQRIMPIVEQYMDNLSYDAQDMAEKMVVFQKNNKKVVLDPHRQFGQPLVEGTGYRADVLANAFYAENSSYGRVASDFNVADGDVKIAVEYMKSLERRKKAA